MPIRTTPTPAAVAYRRWLGGFFGKVWASATQSAGGFLPEFHTDFVFAFLSETFGFCGSFLLLCLYVLLIFSTIRVVL